MTTTQRAIVASVLDALQHHGCISGYTIGDTDGHPDWLDDGFEKAFHELQTNSKPLGLKKKNERAWLMIVLAQKDKKAVDDWTLNSIKQNYDL